MSKAIILLFLIFWTTFASIIHVPEDFHPPYAIQNAINDADNGDTVSIWGYDDPPFIYYENINFSGKNILVVNRSYITTIQGYPPNPSYVVIDTAHGGAVVTFESRETHEAILKGFTIRT